MNLQQVAKSAKLSLVLSGTKAAAKVLQTIPGISFPDDFDQLQENEQRDRITGALAVAIEPEKPDGKPKEIYRSLDEIFTDAKDHQVTGGELLNRRTHICGQWQAINLSDELREKVISTIAETIGGHAKRKNRVYSVLRYGRPKHWTLDRFLLSKYGDSPARLSYCAGQDQTWEMRDAREQLTK